MFRFFISKYIIFLYFKVHFLIDCEVMRPYRESCEVGRFVRMHRQYQPQISSVKLYVLFLDDSDLTKHHERVTALYYMKMGWNREIGIST